MVTLTHTHTRDRAQASPFFQVKERQKQTPTRAGRWPSSLLHYEASEPPVVLFWFPNRSATGARSRAGREGRGGGPLGPFPLPEATRRRRGKPATLFASRARSRSSGRVCLLPLLFASSGQRHGADLRPCSLACASCTDADAHQGRPPLGAASLCGACDCRRGRIRGRADW